MHPLRRLRLAAFAAVSDAAPTVQIDGSPAPVALLDHPPEGALMPEGSRPGAYVYLRDERVEPASQRTNEHRSVIDWVCQVEGFAATYMDQLDELCLAVQLAMIADRTLGGAALDLRYSGSQIVTERGEVVFASRRLSFPAVQHTLIQDPRVLAH